MPRTPTLSRLSQFQSSLKHALETFQSLPGLETVVNEAADAVSDCLLAGRKLLLCGNGGSASDASHIATEFTCRFNQDRRPYPAISLNADAGLLTAVSNDYAYQDVFARQIAAYGVEGDVLIALTTSGKSRNILAALEEARRRKLRTIAILGKGGGFTAGAAEIEVLVAGTETARIQEAQKFLLHVLCEIVEERLPKE